MLKNSAKEDGSADSSIEVSSNAVSGSSTGESVVQNFVNILNKNDVHSIIEIQKQILDSLEKVDEMSVKCIEINEKLLKQKKSEIAEIMAEADQVKSLLQSIFRKIAILKQDESRGSENKEKDVDADADAASI